jgi:threonine/homoserine/homoserine lactone efflux protein
LAKWVGGAVWAGSWYLMYLEITRWRHVKPSLAFNSDPVPESSVRPRPGLPLILLYIACAAAPLVVLAALAGQVRERRAGHSAVIRRS